MTADFFHALGLTVTAGAIVFAVVFVFDEFMKWATKRHPEWFEDDWS